MLPEGRTEKCDTPGSVIAQVPRLWEQFTGDVYMSSDSGSEFSFLELHECHPCFLCACWEQRCKSTAKRVQEGQWDRFEVECDCDKLGLREHNIAKESEGGKKEQQRRMSFISSAFPDRKKENGEQWEWHSALLHASEKALVLKFILFSRICSAHTFQVDITGSHHLPLNTHTSESCFHWQRWTETSKSDSRLNVQKH